MRLKIHLQNLRTFLTFRQGTYRDRKKFLLNFGGWPCTYTYICQTQVLFLIFFFTFPHKTNWKTMLFSLKSYIQYNNTTTKQNRAANIRCEHQEVFLMRRINVYKSLSPMEGSPTIQSNLNFFFLLGKKQN